MIRRCEVVDPTQVQILHVYNRCVRRAFLCGVDSLSGRDYSHRKDWLQLRMEYLTGLFAFDIATFAIMSNHFHIVLRSRPDIVAAWSDEEVALRNMKLQGKVWFRPDGSMRRTAPAELQRIVSDPAELQRIRRKLSDLSSLMSYFDESIAKQANAEDEVKGAFWEGVFGCELLEDEASVLACMAYVDLNPIRAMLAETLEESDHTGAFERIHELRQQLAMGQIGDEGEVAGLTETLNEELVVEKPKKSEMIEDQAEPNPTHAAEVFAGLRMSLAPDWERHAGGRIGWMAPIEIDERGSGLALDLSGRRPSYKGFLPISLMKYLEIVEWAGRQQRADKGGSIPSSLEPIFDRIGFSSTGFLESMMQFASREKYFELTERRGQPERSFAEASLV